MFTLGHSSAIPYSVPIIWWNLTQYLHILANALESSLLTEIQRAASRCDSHNSVMLSITKTPASFSLPHSRIGWLRYYYLGGWLREAVQHPPMHRIILRKLSSPVLTVPRWKN